MRNRIPSALVRAAALIAAAALAFPADDAREEAADKAAFQAVCGSCHALSMVEGLRTESEWYEEVEQMIKIGAKGTDEQFDRVMSILLRTLTKVNVNTATASQIAPVLDVSDATAQAIVKRRTQDGKFRSIEDLKKVAGVDPAKLEARGNRITF
jgi:competence protein ComEA